MDAYLHSDIKIGEKAMWFILWVLLYALSATLCAISCNKFWENNP